jgi:hypothetical protein
LTLLPIKNTENFKKEVRKAIDTLSVENPNFTKFISKLLKGGGLFIVGGFLRNIANGKKDSRDVDLISSLETENITSILAGLNLSYSVNRMEGIKIKCDSIKIDIWSINKNWSFEKKRVKWNLSALYRPDILIKKIADGSFFNFDSLVLDLQSYNCSVSNYNDCIETNTLDILRKKGRYKYQNPTREANILRAYFVSTKYGLKLSENTKTYIVNELNNIESLKSKNAVDLIVKKSEEYIEKYHSIISKKELSEFLASLRNDMGPLFEVNT